MRRRRRWRHQLAHGARARAAPAERRAADAREFRPAGDFGSAVRGAARGCGAARSGCRISNCCCARRSRSTRAPPRGSRKRFAQVWSGAFENDGFNRLVLLAGLSSRQVLILRLYCKILRQAGSAFSQAYMEDTLAAHPGDRAIARRLVRGGIRSRRAGTDRDTRSRRIAGEIEGALEQVANLDEDRILRGYLLLIAEIAAHQPLSGGAGRAAEGLPLRQAREPRDRAAAAAAAVRRDLRLQPARRGLPSARRQGRARRHALVRPQGGFPHRGAGADEGADGEERRHRAGRLEGRLRGEAPAAGGRPRRADGRRSSPATRRSSTACSTSPTTSRAKRSCRRAHVVRRDADDPYLVVAADKGTATFSDIANGVAHEYGFWLDDAFASGGSVGYDHKAMGITVARRVGSGEAPLPRNGP